MSKRRINKQQSARIQKIQAGYLSDETSATADGLVLSRFSRHADIEDSEGNRIHCSIRPNIDSLVAGDRVIWQAEGTTHGVVVSRYPRVSMLGRPDKRGKFKPIAANITQIVIVLAVRPELSWPLLDSYLVMAEQLKIKVCIILNKIDLDCDAAKKELLACYEPLGYQILFFSSQNNPNYEELKDILNHQISVFVGQSGVGKSSLIAGLLPHENNIQVGEISTISKLGRHTTSNSRYFHLSSGGALIDSPGVREMSLWHMPIAEITQGYREFKPLISKCKFRNCNHRSDPECAIMKALNEGRLSQNRYDNYLKIASQYGK